MHRCNPFSPEISPWKRNKCRIAYRSYHYSPFIYFRDNLACFLPCRHSAVVVPGYSVTTFQKANKASSAALSVAAHCYSTISVHPSSSKREVLSTLLTLGLVQAAGVVLNHNTQVPSPSRQRCWATGPHARCAADPAVFAAGRTTCVCCWDATRVTHGKVLGQKAQPSLGTAPRQQWL